MKYLKFIPILTFFVCLYGMSLPGAYAQTPVSTPSPTLPVAPTDQISDPNITYTEAEDLLEKLVAEKSSEQAIEYATQTVEYAQWLLATVLGLGVAAGSGIIYLANKARKAEDAAARSSAAADRSATEAQDSKEKIEELQTLIEASLEELKLAKAEAKQIKTQLRYMQHSGTEYEKLIIVRRNSIKLFNDDNTDREMAAHALIEYSRDENAVVRLECIEVFRKLLTYSIYQPAIDQIFFRLGEIGASDAEPMLQEEAKNLHEQLKSRLKSD